MFSIGILGFLVWSLLVASPLSDKGIYNNLAICWDSSTLVMTLACKTITSYTQSAGNQSLNSVVKNKSFKAYKFSTTVKLSASETIRETSFNFNSFRKSYDNKHISDDWLTWFIGFAEGDGCIFSDRKTSRLRFVLTQKERAILDHIQKKFGFGVVKSFPSSTKENANRKIRFHRWIVEDSTNIRYLALLFNGNLCIQHRIEQLSNWVEIINKKNSDLIEFNNIPLNISLNDAWLSGFSDAEGCFNVSITINKRYALGSVIKLRFLLDQKNETILNSVKSLFGFGKVTLRKETEDVYRYTATGFSRMNGIRPYFDKYPLKTKKSISLQKWSLVHDMVINKEHLFKEGLEKIRIFQKQINLNNSMTIKTGFAKP